MEAELHKKCYLTLTVASGSHSEMNLLNAQNTWLIYIDYPTVRAPFENAVRIPPAFAYFGLY